MMSLGLSFRAGMWCVCWKKFACKEDRLKTNKSNVSFFNEKYRKLRVYLFSYLHFQQRHSSSASHTEQQTNADPFSAESPYLLLLPLLLTEVSMLSTLQRRHRCQAITLLDSVQLLEIFVHHSAIAARRMECQSHWNKML